MRVLGLDPGTVSIDVCGIEDGRVFLDRSLPTAQALADPGVLPALIDDAGPLDLVAGPSGYGLPLVAARDLTDADIRLATLSPPGEEGGIGGLGALLRALRASPAPIVFTPGVIHLPSVPAHRKVNRVDMGTADKVCAAALAIHDQASRLACDVRDTSCILLELGGAFSAALAVAGGRIVDGMGGTSGPLGLRAAGALDGEVAYLAGTVTKRLLFGGGAHAIAGIADSDCTLSTVRDTDPGRTAWDAYIESAAKAVAALLVTATDAREIVVSGRMAAAAGVLASLEAHLVAAGHRRPLHRLTGFARTAKQAAQGAALVADGLAGGASAHLVEVLGLRDASGTVLDHLHVITRAAARTRLRMD